MSRFPRDRKYEKEMHRQREREIFLLQFTVSHVSSDPSKASIYVSIIIIIIKIADVPWHTSARPPEEATWNPILHHFSIYCAHANNKVVFIEFLPNISLN
jgi:hypothetical protein